MSCYESERGDWSLPSKDWVKTRNAILKASLVQNHKTFTVAVKFWELAKAVKSIKDYRAQFSDLIDKAAVSAFGRTYNYGTYRSNTPDWFNKMDILDMCQIPREFNWNEQGAPRPKKPVASKHKHKLPKIENCTSFSSGDLYVEIYEKSRTIGIVISENNRACQSAWSSELGQAVLSRLQSTPWTGNNGGYSIYRSEYQEDYEPCYEKVFGGKGFLKNFNKCRGW